MRKDDVNGMGDVQNLTNRSRRNRSTTPVGFRSKSLTPTVKCTIARFSDDGSVSFGSLWNYHSLTVLAILVSFLVYVTFFEVDHGTHDSSYNTYRGVLACCLAYVCYGLTQSVDGPFMRPHPAFWRLILSLTVLYELGLIYILLQSYEDARRIVWSIDSSLGEPLVEQSYGGNCAIWDFENKQDPLHNFWSKCDCFVAAHVVSWWAKMMIVRSVWMCLVMSFLFECLEYSLEHQLANFAECWWDHWILDFVVFNGLGIWLGSVTLRYLNAKNYHWRSVWSIPSVKGKMSRVFLQFTPYYWTEFHWNPFLSFQRYISLIAVIFCVITAELNSFYMKYVFWVESEHWINVFRLVLMGFAAAVGLAEFYKYATDMHCTKIGTQAWVIVGIVITECLVVVKFASSTVFVPFPGHVIAGWAALSTIWVVHALHHFLLPAWRIWRSRGNSQRGSTATLS